ncbi:L7Ae/L30e/S12e/Gadd45 family ribosomal protein [Thermoanaerobacterium sp. DL9XJH110]|uniref:L7Ae/L30e/S12e/Gadd45 family ribosomal protein n=1 Tax=Thermoanaerobacterium sp. DL9XJH110 TaxID=3386643 RepID=UPI003BB5AF80
MRADGVLSLLGIAQKARKIISGQEAVERAVGSRKVFLVIISEDASENTRKKFFDLCDRHKVQVILWGKSGHLGKAIGKEDRKVVGVADKGLAKEVLKRINFLTGVGDIDKASRV